jgi:hypothetical protein
MYNKCMTLLHIAIGALIVVVALIASIGRWAWAIPRFERWFLRRFPRIGRVLITPNDERPIP